MGWRWEEEVGGLTVFEEGGWQLLMYRLEGGRTRAVVAGEEGEGQGVVVTGWECQEGILVPRYEVDKQKIEKIELITEFPHTVAEEDRIKYQLVKLKNIELEEEDRRTYKGVGEVKQEDGESILSFWENEMKSETCSKLRTLHLKAGSLPERVLVSFAGSGNSWLRMMIETSTGMLCRKFYF